MTGESVSQLFRGSVLSVQSPSCGDEGICGSVSNSRGQNFVVDYTVRAITDVIYFRVSRSLYQAAKSATLLERAQRDVQRTNENEKCDSEFERTFSRNKEDADLVKSFLINRNSLSYFFYHFSWSMWRVKSRGWANQSAVRDRYTRGQVTERTMNSRLTRRFDAINWLLSTGIRDLTLKKRV